MIRKPQMLFKLGGLFTDAVSVLFVALFLATSHFRAETIIFALVFLIFAQGLLGMYRLDRRETLLDTFVRCFLSSTAAFLAGLFLFEPPLSVDIGLRIIILTSLFMTAMRILLSEFEQSYYDRGLGRVPVIVIGMSRAGESLLRQMKSREDLSRIHILGFLDNAKKDPVEETPWLGKLVDLERVITEQKPQALIQIGQPEQIVTITTICQRYNLEYHILPSLIGAFGKKVDVTRDAGIPLIKVKETNMHGWGFLLKRLFDIIAGLILLILTAPALLAAGITVMIERKTLNPFTAETRIDGRNGRSFSLYRFKTLKEGAQELPLNADEIKLHSQGVVQDKSLQHATTLGAFLRKTELNELPQLFNVLKNDMSIVGPRPPFQEETEHYTNFHQKRLRLKPGITGLWQIEKEKTDGSHDALLKKDIHYVENWSLGLDALIVLKTAAYAARKLIS